MSGAQEIRELAGDVHQTRDTGHSPTKHSYQPRPGHHQARKRTEKPLRFGDERTDAEEEVETGQAPRRVTWAVPELQSADGKSAAEEDETETEHQQASILSSLYQETQASKQ